MPKAERKSCRQEDPEPGTCSQGTRPHLLWTAIISQALMSSEDTTLTLSELYMRIEELYPYFR